MGPVEPSRYCGYCTEALTAVHHYEGSSRNLYTTKHQQSPLRVITVVIFHIGLSLCPNRTKEKGGLYFSHRNTQTRAYTRGPPAAALSAIDQPVTRNIACLFSSPRPPPHLQSAACKTSARAQHRGSKAGLLLSRKPPISGGT